MRYPNIYADIGLGVYNRFRSGKVSEINLCPAKLSLKSGLDLHLNMDCSSWITRAR
jgi:hypothetical protein